MLLFLGVPRHGRVALSAQTFLPCKKVTAAIANAKERTKKQLFERTFYLRKKSLYVNIDLQEN